MRTLGIDLAAQAKKTAVCAIEWVSEMALVETPQIMVDDADLLAGMERADWVGIDAPFGWPQAMLAAIALYTSTDEWPATAASERLRYRRTDLFVHETIARERERSVWPLSVSSDRIAVCAWRCARLLSAYAQGTGRRLDRIGFPLVGGVDGAPAGPPRRPAIDAGGVVEVYPAGALAMWGLPHHGYKHNAGLSAVDAHAERARILEQIERDAGTWLILTGDVHVALLANDDAFDAFISSLVACAAAIGETIAPSIEDRGVAQLEGWIHLPERKSLVRLAPAAV